MEDLVCVHFGLIDLYILLYSGWPAVPPGHWDQWGNQEHFEKEAVGRIATGRNNYEYNTTPHTIPHPVVGRLNTKTTVQSTTPFLAPI